MTKDIEIAKGVAEDLGYSQVVILGLKDSDLICTTYGITKKDCSQAAEAGVFWRQILALEDPIKRDKIRDILE